MKGTDGSAVAPPVVDNAHSIKGSLTARANAAEGDPAKGLELAFRLREVELE